MTLSNDALRKKLKLAEAGRIGSFTDDYAERLRDVLELREDLRTAAAIVQDINNEFAAYLRARADGASVEDARAAELQAAAEGRHTGGDDG